MLEARYGDVIYDQSYDNTFQQKMKSIQTNAVLAKTGALRGASGAQCRKAFKIIKNQSPKHSMTSPPLEVHTEHETSTIFVNSM